MSTKKSYDEEFDVQKVLKKQTELIRENNILLKKIRRYEMVNFWIKILWIALLIGVPFFLYYYFIEPYLTALNASYEAFNAQVQGIPGYDLFRMFLNGGGGGGQ